MSGMIKIEIPREIAAATRMSSDELRIELAVHLFEQKKLSMGKASETARMSEWDFMQLLGLRGISWHYDVEDFEADLEILQKLRHHDRHE